MKISLLNIKVKITHMGNSTNYKNKHHTGNIQNCITTQQLEFVTVLRSQLLFVNQFSN